MGNLQDDHFPDMTHAMGHQSKHITMHLYVHMIQRQDDFPFYQPAFTTKYSHVENNMRNPFIAHLQGNILYARWTKILILMLW